jgi:hypothetical protein
VTRRHPQHAVLRLAVKNPGAAHEQACSARGRGTCCSHAYASNPHFLRPSFHCRSTSIGCGDLGNSQC